MEGELDLNPFRRRLLKNGVSADARVMEEIDISKWQSADTGMRTREFVVEVQAVDEAPFQVKIKDAFSAGWAPKRGDLLKVKYNPKSHKAAFDLAGDPRYNYTLQKQSGQWKPGEAGPPSVFGTGSRGEVLPPAGAPGAVPGAVVFQGMPDADTLAAAIAAAQAAAVTAMGAAGAGMPEAGAAAAAPSASGAADVAARLQQLTQLRDAGVISAEDFDAQKARILESL